MSDDTTDPQNREPEYDDNPANDDVVNSSDLDSEIDTSETDTEFDDIPILSDADFITPVDQVQGIHATSEAEMNTTEGEADFLAETNDEPELIPAERPPNTLNFEELTLAEMLGHFWRAPIQTYRSMFRVA